MANAQFVNCRIGTLSNSGVNASVINCVIWGCSCDIETAYNSYVCIPTAYHGTINAYNCIIRKTGYYDLSQYSTARNCIGINGALNSAMKENCWYYANCSEVFDTFTGGNYDAYTEQLILKEEIASTCIGDDGAQVGIYGGYAPYNPRPSYMVIKRCNVASQSTIDGKLSVDIEVVTGGE